MQCYSRVQVTSLVLRLTRSRIQRSQYLRLTRIGRRMAKFKAQMHGKANGCGLVILNSIREILIFSIEFSRQIKKFDLWVRRMMKLSVVLDV